MHKPNPDNRISESNGTLEIDASHLLTSKMRTPALSFFLFQKIFTFQELCKNEMREGQKAT